MNESTSQGLRGSGSASETGRLRKLVARWRAGAASNRIDARFGNKAAKPAAKLLQQCADQLEAALEPGQPSAGAPPTGEATFREDERQACWEDFVQVLRNGVTDKASVKNLLHGVYEQGWQQLGTGDGKPMHQRENSAVREWLNET